MKWIIDLLIEKWNRDEKQEEFEPIPLYIEDDWVTVTDGEKQDKNVIIIDL